MSNIQQLEEQELPQNCFIFKNSTACPVSHRAAQEIESAISDLPIIWVNVIEQRDLSNWIADEFGVRHESPQLLRVDNGKVTKIWNHGEITKKIFG